MSDLRHLTAAFRAFATRLNSIEDCLAIVLRNSEQESDWRHEQRNIEHRRQADQDESAKAMKQVQEAVGAISHRLASLHDAVEKMGSTRLSDVKELRQRMQSYENRLEMDEVTKT